MKSFSYVEINTEIFGNPVALEANGHSDDSGQVYITELFHCLDNTQYSQPFNDAIKSPFLRSILENLIKEQLK